MPVRLRTRNVVLGSGESLERKDRDDVASQGVCVEVDDEGRIALISDYKAEDKVDYEADWILPGFIDIHNHGFGGATSVLEYWLHDTTIEQLPKYGTTSVIASVTLPKDASELTSRVFQALEDRISNPKEGCARIRGIHAEGPIIQTCGGLPNSHRDITVDELKQLLDSAPSMKIMTISPSLEKEVNYARLRLLIERGVTPAIGHDLVASEDAILGALRVAGEYRTKLHMTHMFNASAFHHRNVTLCNFGLLSDFPRGLPGYEDPNIQPPTIEVIGDLVHVHPLPLKLAIDNRGDELAIITDAIMDNTAVGSRNYAGGEVEVQRVPPIVANETLPRGKVVVQGTNTIAGSCTNMLRIFYDLVNLFRLPLPQIAKMLSETPAKVAKIDKEVGSVTVGKRADLLLFDKDLTLTMVLVDGKVVYRRDS